MLESNTLAENLAIAEVPGLYGLVGIPELLVQKIWLRGDYRKEALKTDCGQRLKVIRPGKWNRLGGPDFTGAEIELDGKRILGDVEIHFYARDWTAHQHDVNSAFDGVVLHVVLFAKAGDSVPCRTEGGRLLPLLHLAPLLKDGLEAYAMQDALLALESTDPLDLAAPFLKRSLPDRRARLREAAGVRWKQKCHYLEVRLKAAGNWSEACHQMALEILGYGRNRSPMAELGLRYPLSTWVGIEGADVRKRYDEKAWRLQGNRPANHPLRRLEQYARLVAAVPDWPKRLGEVLRSDEGVGEAEESTRAYRRRLQLSGLRKRIAEEVLAGEVASPRAETLMIDGLLPLAAVHFGKPELYIHWLHWWPGDFPGGLRQFLQTAGIVTQDWPLSNGFQQGALQTLIEREG